VEFLLAGGPAQGNPTSVSDAQLSDWNRTNVMRHLGHVSTIDELLSEVDLVVLPSYKARRKFYSKPPRRDCLS
jgi:hypothetical protein